MVKKLVFVILLISSFGCVQNRQAQTCGDGACLGSGLSPNDFFPPVDNTGGNTDGDGTGQSDPDPEPEVEVLPVPSCIVLLNVPSVIEINTPVSAQIITVNAESATIGSSDPGAVFNQPVSLNANKVGILPLQNLPVGEHSFFGTVANSQHTGNCGPVSVQVVDNTPPPSCTLTKVSKVSTPGEPVIFSMVHNGGIPLINGFELNSLPVPPNGNGVYVANGKVIGPQSQVLATCQKIYEPPSCDLEVSVLNRTTASLTLSYSSQSSRVSFDGSPETSLDNSGQVSYEFATKGIGAHTVVAEVKDVNGNVGECEDSYEITGPDPNEIVNTVISLRSSRGRATIDVYGDKFVFKGMDYFGSHSDFRVLVVYGDGREEVFYSYGGFLATGKGANSSFTRGGDFSNIFVGPLRQAKKAAPKIHGSLSIAPNLDSAHFVSEPSHVRFQTVTNVNPSAVSMCKPGFEDYCPY